MSGEKTRRNSQPCAAYGSETHRNGVRVAQSGTVSRSAAGHADRSSCSVSEDIFREVHASLARSKKCLARTRTRLERSRNGKPMDDAFARPSQARFDVATAVLVLEKLAQMAADPGGFGRQLEPGAPIVAAAAGLLVDAKGWLENEEKRPPILDEFPGETVLVAHSKSLPIDLDLFVSALRRTAVALVQMGKLRDLRPE